MQQKKGRLFIVATPIGNLEDISYRAVNILSNVSLIAAEDTRHSKKLLQHLNVKKPILSLHAHNEKDRVRKILSYLIEGHDIALISDAGTPLISDPGQKLVWSVHQEGFIVTPIPGPCALIAALSVSGMPANQFIFEGFLPVNTKARQERLRFLKHETRTCVLYESPHRIIALLNDIKIILGEDRMLVISRELTKKFETVFSGRVEEVLSYMTQDLVQQKGEFVVVISGAVLPETAHKTLDAENVLKILFEENMSVSQAVKLTARLTGGNKNRIYTLAIAMQENQNRK